MPDRQPAFIILGAAKSATTWWQHTLAAHPQLFIPLIELHHFSFGYDPASPLPAQYLTHFAEAKPGQRVGENSNSYLPHPRCAQRIHDTLPDAKLIVSLRNPIARAYSDWEMRIRQGLRIHDATAYLDPDHVPDFEFLRKGLYAHQLGPYLERFGRERVLVLIADDLKNDAEGEFHKACRFLGVDDTVPLADLEAINTRDQTAVFPGLRRSVSRTRWGAPVVSLLRRSPIRSLARMLFARAQHAPPMPDETRHKLKSYYRGDVEALSAMLGRDLTHWLD
ncbi:MAG: sulfotransferase family protein [Phycisphaeraceae bacterium]